MWPDVSCHSKQFAIVACRNIHSLDLLPITLVMWGWSYYLGQVQWSWLYAVSQNKFPPLNCLQLCLILTDFQNFCTAGKHMKFATKPIQHYPTHLRHVSTLPWETENQISADIQQMWKKMQTQTQTSMNTHLPWYLMDSPVGLLLVLLTQD